MSRCPSLLAIFLNKTPRSAMAPLMRGTRVVALLLGIFAVLAGAFTLHPSAQAAQTEELDSTIEYLIGQVSGSGLTFIRNADHYPAAEAAEHMRRKYAHFKGEIRTPEDFIARCATRSLLTGKPYLVITQRGEEIPTSDWLGRMLEAYRSQRRQTP